MITKGGSKKRTGVAMVAGEVAVQEGEEEEALSGMLLRRPLPERRGRGLPAGEVSFFLSFVRVGRVQCKNILIEEPFI